MAQAVALVYLSRPGVVERPGEDHHAWIDGVVLGAGEMSDVPALRTVRDDGEEYGLVGADVFLQPHALDTLEEGA